MLICTSAYSSRSYPYPVRVFQPNGTSFMMRICGDEFFSYKTTIEGYVISQGKDGYYYYSDYDSGILTVSERRVGTVAQGYSKTAPSIPYSRQKLSEQNIGTGISLAMTKSSNTTVKSIVIPVQFKDLSFSISSPQFMINNLFNGLNYSYDGATGSVKDYFRDNLGNDMMLQFDVFQVVTLGENVSYYGEDDIYGSDANIRALIKDACSAAAGAGLDFSGYDSDGDGDIDNVFIIFAGHNEAEGGGDNTLWPQTLNVSASNLYFGGKRVNDFSCYSEFSGASGNVFAGPGTICHEYCHFLGLPDMYDLNGETEGKSEALYKTLSIMDYGNYNNGGKTPPYLNAVEKELLGLLAIADISRGYSYELPLIRTSNRVFRIKTAVNGEYFLLESRDNYKWDKYTGGSGMVIYHIDKSQNNAGSMSAEMRWKTNSINCNSDHQCVKLFDALGNGVFEEMFYPGSAGTSSIVSYNNSPLRAWSGDGIAVGMKNLYLTSSYGVAFELVEDFGWDIPYATDYFIEVNQKDATLKWDSSYLSDDNWTIYWGAKKNVYFETLIVEGREHNFTNLSAGEEYHCEIFVKRHNMESKRMIVEFTTMKSITDYPLIAEMEKEYCAGDSVRLHILNHYKEPAWVKWYINDEKYDSNYYKFKEKGNYTVKCIYSDDGVSECVLMKKLLVKNKVDE